MHKIRNCLLAVALSIFSITPALAQRNDNRNGHDNRSNYYSGMRQSVGRGDYGRYSRDDEQRHHHDDRGGGIGPGKAALIGGAGGAALGALFGGGLKEQLSAGPLAQALVHWAASWLKETIITTGGRKTAKGNDNE